MDFRETCKIFAEGVWLKITVGKQISGSQEQREVGNRE